MTNAINSKCRGSMVHIEHVLYLLRESKEINLIKVNTLVLNEEEYETQMNTIFKTKKSVAINHHHAYKLVQTITRNILMHSNLTKYFYLNCINQLDI